MSIRWTQDWSVGEPVIDDQHRELVDRVNALLEAVGQNRSRAEIANTMVFLEVYILRHFRDEERLMERTGYPLIEAHRLVHQTFEGVFSRLKEEYEREGPTAAFAAELNVRVSGWLVTHVGKLDRAFGEYLAGLRAMEGQAGEGSE